MLSRKAENQSYQATIQTDVQNEPNSCKITKAGPPASEMSSVHEKNSQGYGIKIKSWRCLQKMSQKTVRRVSSSSSELFTLRLNESWVRADAFISNILYWGEVQTEKNNKKRVAGRLPHVCRRQQKFNIFSYEEGDGGRRTGEGGGRKQNKYKKLVTESNTSLNLGPQGRARRLVEKVFQPKKLKKIIGVFNTYPLENQVKGVVPNIWTEKERQRRRRKVRWFFCLKYLWKRWEYFLREGTLKNVSKNHKFGLVGKRSSMQPLSRRVKSGGVQG